jgi:hypothetical protein
MKIKTPILLNADIFQGTKSPPSKFDPIIFINQSIQIYPDCALSLGWTTNDNILTNYTWKDMFQAYSVLKSLDLIGSSTEITFGKLKFN